MTRSSRAKSILFILFSVFEFSAHAQDVTETTTTPPSETAPATPLYKASFSISYDKLNQDFSPWIMSSASLSRKFSFGSLIARMNRARRFDSEGTQFEVDAYPSLRAGTYLYLNYGTSGDSIFPVSRYGAEIYQSFAGGWEGSLGTRQLSFSQSFVRILTASIAKYLGNYYFVIREYSVPDSSGDSASVSLQVRRYFGDENYFAVSVGAGRSPTFRAGTNDVVVLSSEKVGLDLYRQISGLWYGSANTGYSREEIRSGVFRDDWASSLGVEKRF